MNYLATVLNKTWLTPNVFQLSIERPESFTYQIGQALEISLHKDTEFLKAPFTITSIYENDKDLQFIIKVYPEHNGITVALSKLKVNDTILITDAWDSFAYKGEGVFIAAGSGITPFIPILRLLKEKNKIEGHKLIYANRTERDIILKYELETILGNSFYNLLSRDHLSKYGFGRVDYGFLSDTIDSTHQYFYVCGPKPFLESINKALLKLGVNKNLIQLIY